MDDKKHESGVEKQVQIYGHKGIHREPMEAGGRTASVVLKKEV